MSFTYKKAKVNWKVAVFAFVLLVVNGIVKPGFNENLQTTYVGVLSFLILVYISYFVRHKLWHEICDIVSKYSYAIFWYIIRLLQR